MKNQVIAIVIASQKSWLLVTLYMVPSFQVPTSLSFLDSQFSSLKVTSSSRSFCRTNPTKNKMPEDSLAQLNQEDDIKKN